MPLHEIGWHCQHICDGDLLCNGLCHPAHTHTLTCSPKSPTDKFMSPVSQKLRSERLTRRGEPLAKRFEALKPTTPSVPSKLSEAHP